APGGERTAAGGPTPGGGGKRPAVLEVRRGNAGTLTGKAPARALAGAADSYVQSSAFFGGMGSCSSAFSRAPAGGSGSGRAGAVVGGGLLGRPGGGGLLERPGDAGAVIGAGESVSNTVRSPATRKTTADTSSVKAPKTRTPNARP